MGNNLPTVSGTIETRVPIAVSGTIVPRTKSGPRYPRAHLQMIVVDAKR